MSSPNQPTCTGTSFLDSINCGSGSALGSSNQSINALLAAIAFSFGTFGVEIGIFLLLRLRLSRIYRPRSYLVPERERVAAPPAGIVAWIFPLFTTPNLAFIQKCGLDAYFFLRYLRTLLKIFVPISLVLLPILLPLNRYSGDGKVSGLDLLSISNVSAPYKKNRLWAHLILAIGVIAWICYVVYDELRGYIRVRQAYLTSPQHRIRASATTVLVTGIPRKWLTLEALAGLYDVFPGGIKNIWINRNFDKLADKVELRNKYAQRLEGAETNLIKICRKKHEQAEQEKRKKAGAAKKTKDELKHDRVAEDAAAEQMAQGTGITSEETTQSPRKQHTLHDVLHPAEERAETQAPALPPRPLGVVSEQLDKVGLSAVNQGLGAVGHGFGKLGKGLGGLTQMMYTDVNDGVRKAGSDFNHATAAANTGTGFAIDDSLYRQSMISQSDVAPTPPPKTPADERDARLQANRAAHGSEPMLDSARPLDNAAATSNERPLERTSQPLATSAPADDSNLTPESEKTLSAPDIRMTRPSVESRPKSSMQIEEPAARQGRPSLWGRMFKNDNELLGMPSPHPHTADDDEFPLNADTSRPRAAAAGGDPSRSANKEISSSKWAEQLAFWKKDGEEAAEDVYPEAFNKDFDEDQDGEPRWRHYIEPKDRPSMRLPIVNQSWFPSIPFIGPKVDQIHWLRRELAQLNLEIEIDQAEVDKFPFMNSAFIQFNHQVAAHMACQSLSHHIPQNMAPRLLEISPDDVIWDNMSIKWWERYLRTGGVLVISAALIVFYAIPVSFTSVISKLGQAGQQFTWLHWVEKIPKVVLSIIEGALPPLLLNLILTLVPMIFGMLVRQSGVPTGNLVQRGVQTWYFTFLFIQVFFVVTLASGLTAFFTNLSKHPGQVITGLSTSIPTAADYFFSYLLVQALGTSAGALLQIMQLVWWFVLARILDNTPRQKWRRQVNLSTVQWGSFFPQFTNFAVIGIIYSVIAPFILVFMLIIFGLFWIVYRYNVLYVYQFHNDTGGLLFPTAINQLFVGIYFLEVCLAGFFFISKGPSDTIVCIPQGIIMIIVLVFTILYQWQLNSAFQPLLQYLPITLEDEAVIRDEEFARAQESKFAPLTQAEKTDGGEDEIGDERDEDIEEVLADRERAEEEADAAAEEQERQAIRQRRQSRQVDDSPAARLQDATPAQASPRPTWKTDRWRQAAPQAVARIRSLAGAHASQSPADTGTKPSLAARSSPVDAHGRTNDLEAQHTVGDVLYSGFADELEDLTPAERDVLVRYAFQHSALRAKRPVVWIPRDKLGVSDDEIRRAKKMSTVKVKLPGGNGGEEETTNIWMSNEGTALDGKGRVVFRRSPPDFESVDLISL